MSTVLVTGAGGMIGSHLIEYLSERNRDVIGTYYRPTTNIEEIRDKAPLLECDVRYPDNVEKIIVQYKPTEIYHLAAQSYPTVSWERPYETIDTNINGTVAVFEAIKKVRAEEPAYDPIVLVACSSAEYGSTLEELENGMVKEDVPLKPLHPYGVSKVGQDLLAYQYWKNYEIRTIRARIFNTTGTRKVGDVISDFTRRAVEIEKNGKEKVLLVGNIETWRAILDVNDLLEAFILLVEKGTPGEVYNISSEVTYQIKDIIAIIEELMGTTYKLKVDPRLLRSTDERIINGDVERLKRDTGWKQKVDLKKTIADMIKYWRAL